jgi:uncharacterized protein YlxW (UPF0749 family)
MSEKYEENIKFIQTKSGLQIATLQAEIKQLQNKLDNYRIQSKIGTKIGTRSAKGQ